MSKPILNETKYDAKNSSNSNVRPVLTTKYAPLDDLDLLMNTKKIDKEELDNSQSQMGNSERDFELDDDELANEDFGSDFRLNMNENKSPNDNNTNNWLKDGHQSGSISDDEKSSHHDPHNNDSRYEKSSEDTSNSSNSEVQQKKSYQEIQEEKQKLLYILNRLDKAGYHPTRKYNMASNYDDILCEVSRLKRERDIDKSIKFQRKALMAVVSGFEFINHKYDPINAKLDDWSENVMENIGDYDEVFEELHDKYSDKIQMVPELKLLMMIGGSAFMYHLTQTLFKTSNIGLNDILRNNPDIMRNISQAAMNQMGQQNGMQGTPEFNFMQNAVNMTNNQRQRQQQGSNMAPPSGVDDILNELNAENSDLERRRRKPNSIDIDI